MSKAATARAATRKRAPARTVSRRTLSPANRQIRRWLEEWMKTPPLESEEFWRAFKRDLRENRFNLRKPTR